MDRRGFLVAAGAGAMALAGCAETPPRAVTAAPAPFTELEPIYRADATRDGLTISVASSGCTAKPDFAVYATRDGAGAVSLAFARKRVDPCRSFAVGRTDLAFTWAELGASPQDRLVLLNPLVAWRGP
ncbi:MAG: hypothetical protein JF588_06635 [Caulobacterales bacterium]|nr:hypothetical protein [Caulobacterales bacterium]